MIRSKTFDILKTSKSKFTPSGWTDIGIIISKYHVYVEKILSKNIRSYHPDCVHHQVFDPVLVQAKQAKNHEYYVEKIGQNGQPHVAQKVENLSLKSRNKLKRQNGSLARSGHMNWFTHFWHNSEFTRVQYVNPFYHKHICSQFKIYIAQNHIFTVQNPYLQTFFHKTIFEQIAMNSKLSRFLFLKCSYFSRIKQ